MTQPHKSSTESIRLTVDGRRTSGPSRREAMQWVLAAIAAGAAPTLSGCAQSAATSEPKTPPAAGQSPPGVSGQNPGPQDTALKPPAHPTPGGYGVDPVLTKFYKPGEFWPLTFTEPQKKAARTLADTIVPKDDLGPAASEVGVVEMLDEWVSAPYPTQQADRPRVMKILDWVDAESTKRFGKSFSEASEAQRKELCDRVCYAKKAPKELKAVADGFNTFRNLCAAAYYATPEGWKAIGYVGNVALPSFDGPPPEVLKILGVEQTVM